MKRQKNTFWTLDRHHAEGFTLVELIVVIAILAILAGVAVPAYSGYIKQTNMTADQSLISDIQYALTLALYENHAEDIGDTIVVKVSTTGADILLKSGDETTYAAELALVENAMVKAFGTNWKESCKLSYDGWTVDNANVSAYTNSTFNGKEEVLLDTMSTLGGHLTRFFDSGRNVPDQLQEVMDKYNADSSAGASNAAVLALAQGITEAGSTIQTELQNAMNVENCFVQTDYGPVFDIELMGAGISEAYAKYYGTDDGNGNYVLDDDASDMVALATAATMYAYAEGFAQHCAENDKSGPSDILAGVKYTDDEGKPLSSGKILKNIYAAFNDLVYFANTDSAAGQYFYGQSSKDLDAFFAMMNAVDQSADVLGENLNSTACFDNAGSLISGYLAAGTMLSTGEAGVIVNPDRSIVAYLGGLVG